MAEARAKANIGFVLHYKAANSYRVGRDQHWCFFDSQEVTTK